jgi:hypothetical protein
MDSVEDYARQRGGLIYYLEVLLIILRSPVITWPVGLYMNGELAQVQSGCLDLKSLILRSCNVGLLRLLPVSVDDHVIGDIVTKLAIFDF